MPKRKNGTEHEVELEQQQQQRRRRQKTVLKNEIKECTCCRPCASSSVVPSTSTTIPKIKTSSTSTTIPKIKTSTSTTSTTTSTSTSKSTETTPRTTTTTTRTRSAKKNSTKKINELREEYGVEKFEYLPFPEDKLEQYEGLEWITSHLMPTKILWSSDTSKLKPNIDARITASNNVVNTWFVSNSKLSDNNKNYLKNWQSQIQMAVSLLRKASALLIVAGAGMGVDSGLPDYRGPNGFWKDYPLLRSRGLTLEEMSHPDWFQSDPISAWGFYAHRAQLYHAKTPHKGFDVLRNIVSEKKDNYFIFTSNIDSQFQKAGFDDSKIYECHGSLAYLQCQDPDCDVVWESSQFPAVDSELKALGDLPRCPSCGSVARPNVSMFGDTNHSFKDTRSTMQKSSFLQWLRKVYKGFDVASSNKGCGSRGGSGGGGEVKVKSTLPTRRSTRSGRVEDLVILELGCGTSLHSLRLEVELLLHNFDSRCSSDGGEESASVGGTSRPTRNLRTRRTNMNADADWEDGSSCGSGGWVKGIRVNPHDFNIAKGHVGVGLGAMEALLEIGKSFVVVEEDEDEVILEDQRVNLTSPTFRTPAIPNSSRIPDPPTALYPLPSSLPPHSITNTPFTHPSPSPSLMLSALSPTQTPKTSA